jgi:hypothetical protein
MKFWMNILISGLILLVVAGCGSNVEYDKPNDTGTNANGTPSALSPSDQVLKALFDGKISDFQIQGSGTVTKILADDLEGDRHQKFILKLASGQTLLMTHNIDIAPKIDSIAVGDSVEFYGEYVWNGEGGIIHWTHRDPDGVHVDGWLKHEGVVYQ